MAGKPKGAGNEAILSFRIPREMFDRLQQAAAGRSVSEEIRQRLEASFTTAPAANTDPRFADLLTTAAYAVAAAGRMYPAAKTIASPVVAREMFPGERIPETGREVEDITAHWLIEACLHMLLDAFRPAGLPASLPKDAYGAPSQSELLRRADRIACAAVGTLGDRGIEAFSRLAPMDQETIAASGPTGRRLAAEAEKHSDEGSEP